MLAMGGLEPPQFWELYTLLLIGELSPEYRIRLMFDGRRALPLVMLPVFRRFVKKQVAEGVAPQQLI